MEDRSSCLDLLGIRSLNLAVAVRKNLLVAFSQENASLKAFIGPFWTGYFHLLLCGLFCFMSEMMVRSIL